MDCHCILLPSGLCHIDIDLVCVGGVSDIRGVRREPASHHTGTKLVHFGVCGRAGVSGAVIVSDASNDSGKGSVLIWSRDIGGRKWVYVWSILFYAILNIVSRGFVSLAEVRADYFQGSARALNLPMLIIFQFLCGAAGSTALSNVAGTIADLFGSSDISGQAMALFVWSATVGPSIGSPIGELITSNANMGLPWIFWIK